MWVRNVFESEGIGSRWHADNCSLCASTRLFSCNMCLEALAIRFHRHSQRNDQASRQYCTSYR